MHKSLVVLTLAVLSAGVVGCGEKRHLMKIDQNDPTSRQISKLLVDLLANDPQVRIAAAQQLGEMRDDREAVKDALADRLKDNHPQVRAAAADALVKIGTYDAYTELKEASAMGIIEARERYLQVTRALRSQAQQGNRQARDQLTALGERFID